MNAMILFAPDPRIRIVTQKLCPYGVRQVFDEGPRECRQRARAQSQSRETFVREGDIDRCGALPVEVLSGRDPRREAGDPRPGFRSIAQGQEKVSGKRLAGVSR